MNKGQIKEQKLKVMSACLSSDEDTLTLILRINNFYKTKREGHNLNSQIYKIKSKQI